MNRPIIYYRIIRLKAHGGLNPTLHRVRYCTYGILFFHLPIPRLEITLGAFQLGYKDSSQAVHATAKHWLLSPASQEKLVYEDTVCTGPASQWVAVQVLSTSPGHTCN